MIEEDIPDDLVQRKLVPETGVGQLESPLVPVPKAMEVLSAVSEDVREKYVVVPNVDGMLGGVYSSKFPEASVVLISFV